MSDGLPGLIGIDHVSVTVPDLEEAVRFYGGVLGGEPLYQMGPFDAEEMPRGDDGRDWTEAHLNVAGGRVRFQVVRLGTLAVELFEWERPEDVDQTPPRNCDVGGHHFGLHVEDLDAAVEHLRANGVRVLDGPIEIPEPRPGGPARVRYFLDPWGNQLELTEGGTRP